MRRVAPSGLVDTRHVLLREKILQRSFDRDELLSRVSHHSTDDVRASDPKKIHTEKEKMSFQYFHFCVTMSDEL